MANIILNRPAAGEHVSIPAANGSTIVLDFAASQSTLERSNDDLVFRFDGGENVVIENFYTTFDQGDIPQFQVDGQLVSGEDFFNTFGPDLAPAAGPDNSSHRSARYSENVDSDLTAGVDHLDGLDMSVSSPEASTGPMAFDSSPLAGGGDSAPSTTPPPAPPPEPYAPFIRAVLYTPGNTGTAVNTKVFFSEDGTSPFAIAPGSIDFSGSSPWAQYEVSATLPDGWPQNWLSISQDRSTGGLEFRLTPQGVAEMQRLGLEGEDLVSIIRVSVTDRNSGSTFDYNVEFVATADPQFDSASHTAKYGNQAGLDSMGEFHHGKGTNGQYSIISSDKNDEITVSDILQGGSSIHASGSSDPAQMADDYNIITLNSGAQANTAGQVTHITSSDGVLTSSGSIAATAQGSGHDIDMGAGSVDIASQGLSANNGGENRITAADITLRGGSGVSSNSGGKNILDAGDSGTVTVKNGSGGLMSSGEDSLIDVHGGKVDISGNSEAVAVSSQGTVNVSGGTVNITANTGRTVNNWTGGTINIDADDAVNIRLANASQTSAAIMTLGGTTTVKSGGDINIDVDKGTYQTAGINTWSRGTANVEAEKDININVHSEKGSGVTYGAAGIEIGFTHGGRNNITSHHGDIKLDIDASASGAYGITTSGYDNNSDGITTISAKEGTLDIKASGINDSYYAHGIVSSGYGKNVIDAGGLNVDVSLVSGSNSNGYASTTGIAATYDGRRGGINTIDVAGHTDVHVQGGGNSSGIYARGGQNTINTDTLSVDVTSTGALANSRATGIETSGGSNIINVADSADILVTSKDLAAGLYNTSGTLNLTAGGHVDVDVTSTEGKGYGIFGSANLTAQSVSMTIKGDLSAIVMENGRLTASEVRLNAESSGGQSYGMYSTSYAGSTIQSGNGQPLDLEINADYAMHATYGKNSIIGNSTAGGQGDTIRLNGDIFQSGSGQNQITTGAGDDTIMINGAISGAGALQVDGGAGADTLILEASSLSEFLDRYADWLNGLNPSILKGVESILFTGIEDLNDLKPNLDSFFSYVNSVQPPIEVGLQPADVDADTSPLAFALHDDWQDDAQQDEKHDGDHPKTTDALFGPEQGAHTTDIDAGHAADASQAGNTAAASGEVPLDLASMAELQKNGDMPSMGPSESASVWDSVMEGSWQDSSQENTPPPPAVAVGTEHSPEMAIIETAARNIEHG